MNRMDRERSLHVRLAELSAQAKQAGAVGDLMAASFAEEREAEEALLRTALAAAKPALPAICTPEKFFSSVPLRVALIGVLDSKDPPLRRQFYVNEHGHLVEAVYEFKANSWPLVEFGTFKDPSALKLGYRVEDVVTRLLRLCAAAADGNGTKRAQEARRRAERLRAIATLVDAAGGAK